MNRVLSIIWLVLVCCAGPKGASAASPTETPVVGALTETSAIVQFRTDSAASVAIEYATNKNFNNSTTTSTVSTVSGDDFTGQVSLTGLSADTVYWHRLVVDGSAVVPTYVQRFRTLATGTDCVIAVIADVANNQNRSAPQYEEAKNDGARIALQIGDMDHGNPSSLSEARLMHRDNRDPANSHGVDFSRYILSKMAVAHVWDDHDYCGQDEDRHCSTRSDMWQAMDEHWPFYSRPNAANGLWHKFECGAAEVFMLDTRSQRDDMTDTDDSSKSMLDGASIANDQKDWLKDGLRDSTATWKIVVSTVTANTSARTSSDDHWGGYTTEADELADWIVDESIDNVVMVSADIHTGGGADDGTNNRLGVPELTVPHTNLAGGNASNLGTWSEGVTAGTNGRDGYGLLTISSTTLTMEAKDDGGTVRHSIVLTD